ncbi:MAG: succinate dehydrogenase iron-sulfur subunit, partial [Alphaproteobacteria bacterium]|nr:succinate dehydrogenase iron-sulfur subunit [Alphaproteobacteria bacterium]
MAELTLPENSKVKAGKVHPAPENAKSPKTFKIYRWSPD